MRAFADLLERLVYTRSRNAKIKLIADYLIGTPDPDRGWALAALTGELDFRTVKAGLIKSLTEERVDPVLFKMSRSYVGDMAETVSLLWEPRPGAEPAPQDLRLSSVVDRLMALSRAEAPLQMSAYLDAMVPTERFALIKLATGALRIGVSARLAKTALAQAFALDLDAVEEVWHGIDAPYTALFAWGEGTAPQPSHEDIPVFRPFMLAHPLEDARVDLSQYAAEWKWDGVRVQLNHVNGETKLFSRTGDDVTASFPDVADAFQIHGVIDGELLVKGDAQGTADQGGEAASFNALQQRLGRKTVSKKMLTEAPAFVRAYDILFDGAEDLRALPWEERRRRLEAFVPRLPAERFDVSAIVEADDFDHLAKIREGARSAAIEGLMLKRRDSAYIAGRKVGQWYKWKRDPLTADCVIMYAQRGSGRRSSYFSDYTFGCWTEAGELVPVGKAYSGITDEELRFLDKFVRGNTTGRFGPVREVEKTLVLEVAFDSVHSSKRHKSGIAMRFPRIHRIRNDKPAAEADRVRTLEAMID
ncbi:cisplatin damage response ATP-dependent DNA ligase [Pacificimonas sp. WHA3]|uniref:DNA ligase (ATP) n=1 Tax=Pacificimonas pallii TaxID=2827236 RepID=A0ABS6SGC4_9SPHN|nr:cisplatin damage response ATP-dependent DNA ligase [Pacificimonas pallii]